MVRQADEQMICMSVRLLLLCEMCTCARIIPLIQDEQLAASHKLRLTLPSQHACAAGVCSLCFSPNTTHKHGATVAQFRVPFEMDLNPASQGFPTSLGELAARLKLWRARLAATLDNNMPTQLQLEHEARNLQVIPFACLCEHAISSRLQLTACSAGFSLIVHTSGAATPAGNGHVGR